MPSLLYAQRSEWNTQQAVEKLADEKTRLNAAVRLMELAETWPPWMLPRPSDDQLKSVAVLKVGEELWVAGQRDWRRDGRLLSPVLLHTDGVVEIPSRHSRAPASQPDSGPASAMADASAPADELCVLLLAKDADVFPHLLLWRDHVAILENAVRPAITLASPDSVGFDLRKQGGIPYVALVIWDATPPTLRSAEVARFAWEPYELSFSGPRSDKLPDPPGGKFEIDLKASPKLIPTGGDLDAKPIENTPPPKRQEIDIEDLSPPA